MWGLVARPSPLASPGLSASLCTVTSWRDGWTKPRECSKRATTPSHRSRRASVTRRRRLFRRRSNNTTASLPAVTGHAPAQRHSEPLICSFCIARKPGYSGATKFTCIGQLNIAMPARRLRTTNNLPADLEPLGQRRDVCADQVEASADAEPFRQCRDVRAAQVEIAADAQPLGQRRDRRAAQVETAADA
jgi:hypothetical protein